MTALTEHLKHNVLAYIAIAVVGLSWIGFLAMMDERHVKRVEVEDYRIDDRIADTRQEIAEVNDDIERLTLYNQFGSPKNKPARDQIILRDQHKREALMSTLNQLESKRDGR